MTELDRHRLIGLFMAAYGSAEQQAAGYTYRGRLYRVRTVTVAVAEMHTERGGWVPLTQDLADQLLDHVASGKATRDAEEGETDGG